MAKIALIVGSITNKGQHVIFYLIKITSDDMFDKVSNKVFECFRISELLIMYCEMFKKISNNIIWEIH